MTKFEISRRQLLGMLGAATVLPLVGSLPVQAAIPGTLVIATPYSAKSLFPAVDQSSAGKAMFVNIFEGLVRFDVGYNVIPGMAESWERSADGLTVTFKLAQNIKWHDGTPFTAADVVWHFERIVLGRESRAKTIFNKAGFVGVTAKDDYTVEFVATDVPWDMSWFVTLPYASTILPKHLLENVSEEDLQTHEFNTAPIGTGPWKVSEFQAGELLILDANADYYRGAPQMDQLILRTIAQPQSAMLAYEAGEVDALHEWYANIGLASQIERIKALPDTEVIEYTYYNLVRLIFNYREEAVAKYPWLTDVRVRRAFAHAIDKDTLIERAFGGAPIPRADGLFTKTNVANYNDQVAVYEYDVEKSKALFEEAGITADANGVRLTLPMPYTSGETPDTLIQVLAQMLAQVGVIIQAEPLESGAYSSKYWLSPTGWGDIPLTVFSLTPGAMPEGISNIYHSDFTPDKGGRNASFYKNEEVDALLDGALVEADAEKQIEMYKKVQAILMDEVVAVPLYQSYLAQVWNTRIGHDDAVSRPTHFFTPFYQVWEK